VPPEVPAVPEAVAPEPAAPEVTLSPAVPSVPARLGSPKAARGAAKTAPEPPRPELPPADPELSQFRAAHELQVRAQGPAQRRAAIDAYAEYLRAYPRGRFVPEARYNTALDWIKLGDVGAARALLTPFASGVYDGYRQQEARELLDALGPSPERPAQR
jgi:TolA-binding protein